MEQHVDAIETIEAKPAKLWRRLLAFFVDSFILAAPLMLVGMAYFDQAAALGEWGRLVGFTAGVLYFTVFDSVWGGGRSPGKRLLRIAVIGSDGGPLSPAMAGLRTAILYAPITLNYVPLGDDTPTIVTAVLSLLVLGFWLSILYLFLFNRTRRSLHDLIAGAMVVDARTSPAPFPLSTWLVHRIVVASLCALTFVLPFLASRFVDENAGRQEMLSLYNSVVALPAVRAAAVTTTSTSTWTVRSGSTSVQQLQVFVELRARPADVEELGRQIEDAIFANHAQAVGDKDVLIALNYGFNFGGLAAANSRFLLKSSFAQWRQRTNRKDV